MTSSTSVNYWQCQSGPNNGGMHAWIYRGRSIQQYICMHCALIVTKSALQENTNA